MEKKLHFNGIFFAFDNKKQVDDLEIVSVIVAIVVIVIAFKVLKNGTKKRRYHSNSHSISNYKFKLTDND